MDRWPPIVWPLMTLASLLILAGSVGRWEPSLLAIGVALSLMVCALSLYLLKRRGRRPRSVKAAMFGVCGFYLLTAVAGAAAGPEYSVAALLAGVIPLSALALLTAKILDKTAVADGHLHDASTDDGRDTTPGIGLDDETPLGDTPEHSDAQNPV